MELIGEDGRAPTVVVLSHLRYDFVYQRPQQLMSRLAERHPVLFVEEPVRIDGPPHLRVWQPAANVHVLEPQTPVAAMERIVFQRADAGAPGGARPARVEEVTLQLDDGGRVRETHGRREVLRIEPQARRLRLAAGAILGYCDLFAAIPLPHLVELLGDDAPRGVRAAAAELRDLHRPEGGGRRDGREAPARAVASRNAGGDDAERFARNVVRIRNWLATQDIHPAASDCGDGRRVSVDAGTHRVQLAR